MARRAALVVLFFGLLGTLTTVRAQDFDLSQALDDDDARPTSAPKKPGLGNDDLNLEDALGGGGHYDPVTPGPPKPKPYPKPNPKPNQPVSDGGFSDQDLHDGNTAEDGGGGRPRHDGEEQADSPGVVPGIIGAVVMAVAGAISSFIAYQKKKLCFKQNADQADINMENHRNINAEPPVQRTLLEK